MDELLNKILQSDLLNEDTRKELNEAINAQVEEAKAKAREEAIVEAKAEYAAEFIAAKEALVEAIDTKVEELVAKEISELKEDISSFRDLEAEYATKIVDERARLSKILESDMSELVDNLDTFLETRLNEEFVELKESIEEVKKLEFGRTIFEAVQKEYTKNFFSTDATANKLKEATAKLEVVEKELNESKKSLNGINRTNKMNTVLESLQGRAREIMEAILKNTATEKLDETYNTFIGRVLHESTKDTTSVGKTEKESEAKASSVLAESKTTSDTTATKVVTGDTQIVEHDESMESAPKLDNKNRDSLRKLAGIQG